MVDDLDLGGVRLVVTQRVVVEYIPQLFLNQLVGVVVSLPHMQW